MFRRSSPMRFRRGFTLVELLVVIGLMALLGTLSVGGYFAAARGMKVRGAVQDTISFLRNAYQTCQIDQTPVAVVFYNRYTGRKDDGGEMYGTAVAVKMAGRISMKAGGGRRVGANGSASGGTTGPLLVDEFADWNAAYPHEAGQDSTSAGRRLFNMRNIETTAKTGLKGCSSLMNDWVGYVRMSDLQEKEWLATANMDTQTWCDTYEKTAAKNLQSGASDYANGNDFRWGFSFHAKNDGLNAAGWRIGDAYGVPIAEFDLPRGFIFGSSAPQENGEAQAATVAAVTCLPEDATGESFNIPTISISAADMKGGEDALTKVGEVRAKDLRDQN